MAARFIWRGPPEDFVSHHLYQGIVRPLRLYQLAIEKSRSGALNYRARGSLVAWIVAYAVSEVASSRPLDLTPR
ncbi:uncharacterized protein KD926_004077 [Aspergillus affinis]|uniref:uncharacterized protein n=1 Tax=Aspergillus affinis TaxID=1070780 RepID=UPI0022FE27B6|nr:uncharacterized protein KD926_004077 [Aspergillus affinis]KAI9046239.1 hypothetical protein KD926_004077 [Aspergillus affinis]